MTVETGGRPVGLSMRAPLFPGEIETYDGYGLHRFTCDSVIDEFYIPYAAVKLGGKCSKRLFEGRGSLLLDG